MDDRARRLLPPIGALQSFLAAARHESFSRAAAEVGLTQSAISRQIAVLEEWLQTELFDRVGRSVTLNAEGRAYAEAVAPALATIRVATARLLAKPDANALSIATLPSFGMRWLAPRLGRLTRDMPELIVNVAARVHEFDLADADVDAAIHFGRPDWHGVEHDLLFHEQSVPVAAPGLIAERGLRTPADLVRVPLLAQVERRGAWRQWLEQEGVATDRLVDGPVFEHFLMVAQAAVGGAGAALLPRFMIEPELEAGTLVRLSDRALEGEGAYYLVYPAERLQRPAFARFRAWMLAEARGPDHAATSA
jgi:DNA-binding transcriptional LysR family regulator